ncbi:MAG: hypothetical protein CME34_22765 [Gordonia sp.]|nr:hypothetical protein [Gordonia sp. (in: high G+C Gram-positive bacteria)]
MYQCTTLVDQASGYLAADHTIRRVSPEWRGATATVILAKYSATSAFDVGFRRRLREFTTPTGTQDRKVL